MPVRPAKTRGCDLRIARLFGRRAIRFGSAAEPPPEARLFMSPPARSAQKKVAKSKKLADDDTDSPALLLFTTCGSHGREHGPREFQRGETRYEHQKVDYLRVLGGGFGRRAGLCAGYLSPAFRPRRPWRHRAARCLSRPTVRRRLREPGRCAGRKR